MRLFSEKQRIIHVGYFCGLLSGLFWAISGIYYEKLYTDFPMLNAFALNIIILSIAEITLLLMAYGYLIKRKLLPHFNKLSLLAILGGCLGGPVGMICYLQSLQYVGVSYAATISICYPIIASILSIKFLAVKASRRTLFSFVFIVLLLMPVMYQGENSEIRILGIIFAFSCALCWAFEIVISSYVMQHYLSDQVYLFRQIGSSLGYFLIILFMFFYGTYDNLIDFNFFKDVNLWKLEWIVIISSGFSYFLYYKSIAILNPIRAMALNITYSLWAIVLSAVLLSKEISIFLLMIGIIVLMNIFIVAKGEEK